MIDAEVPNVVAQDRIGDVAHVYCADAVPVVSALPEASVDFAVFSPPFASLYTYSNSARDMGNCRDDAEFFEHFALLGAPLFRALRPGRLFAMHCMDLPTSKARDGYVGLRDFPGDLIRAAQRAGFLYHSRVAIWVDPVTAMQRTKAKGLLHMTLRRDSAESRVGIADSLVVLVKPGKNDRPVAHTHEDFPVERWQRYASPVWATVDRLEDDERMLTFRSPRKGEVETATSGIDRGDTLGKKGAREEEDEKHICPLQLGIIRRALRLWTAPGDVVLSPFMGIGSEGFVAVKEGRRFVGVELKESYYAQAVANIESARPDAKGRTLELFGQAP